MDVAPLYEYALPFQVQERRIQQVTERVGNKKAICVIPASFCACALTNAFCYANGDGGHSQ